MGSNSVYTEPIAVMITAEKVCFNPSGWRNNTLNKAGSCVLAGGILTKLAPAAKTISASLEERKS